MNNFERRDKGLAYVTDSALLEDLQKCRRMLYELNTSDWGDFENIKRLVKILFGKSENAFVSPPFFCDYGYNIEVGKNFSANYNCTILDVAKVKIGDNCMLGPDVKIFTAGHPVHPGTRNSGYEYGKEIEIGDNVWIGGGSIVCPGVKIGSNTVIGAGSVVTHDIPSWSVAAGNPCRVIRNITEKERRKLFKNEEIDNEAWEKIVEFTDK